tara:strand:+ start:4239 stop:5042 length:804 start_codon:yes stop_codon:yes gene_type:complete
MPQSEHDYKKYLSGMDIIGEIALIKIKPEFSKDKLKISNMILSNVKHIRSIYLQKSGVTGEFRVKTLSYLSGIDDPVTIYKESGCRFLIDVSKVYFSPRLSNERLRIANIVQPNEKILNMFAGVGPFSIVISKHQPSCSITDIEINPIASEYALENYSLNKTPNITSICGNAHDIIKTQLSSDFSRIIMPLPEKSIEFLDDAISMIDNQGWIHLYCHLNSNNDDVLKDCNNLISKKLDSRCRINSSRIVKHIGPGWYQIVFDINIQK